MEKNGDQIEILPVVNNLLLVLDTKQILGTLQNQKVSTNPLNPIPLGSEGWYLLSSQLNPADTHKSAPGTDMALQVNKNDTIYIRTISLEGNSDSAAVLYTTTDQSCEGLPLSFTELSGSAQSNSTTDSGLPAILVPQIFAASYAKANIAESWPGKWKCRWWPQQLTVQMGLYGLGNDGNSQQLVSYVSISLWLQVNLK